MRPLVISIILVTLTSAGLAQSSADDSTSSSFSATPYVIAGGTAMTLLLLANDQEIANNLLAWKSRHSVVKDLSPIATLGGEAVLAYGVFASVGVFGVLADDAGAIDLAKVGIVSVTGTGIAVQILKRSFGRERPGDASKPGGEWHGPALLTPFDSFPSGHATTAFTVATVLTDMNEDEPWIGYIAYPLAGAVALSRITENRHWASDVVAGALLGTYGTKLILTTIRSSSIISITPRISANTLGLTLEARL